MKNPDVPVRREWMPLDQSEGLKFVYDAAKCDRLHIKELRQSALANSFVSGQIRQHLPLRSGQPGTARILLKSLSKQPRNIVQQEIESG